ncbi:hypothetical protein NQ317_016657, partial [Molorchus minor]
MLGEIGLTRTQDLTPRARYLYKKNRVLNKSLRQLKVRRTLFKRSVPKGNSQESLHKALMPLQRHVADFIKSQINAIGKDPRGRRYTTEDKIMGLILHKQSGRAYRTMQKLFCLPSRKTLMALLNRIPLGAGINDCIFQNLKINAAMLRPEERYCVLIFDEMSLEPHINLNIRENCFEGFENFGNGDKVIIADHAQVFMLKGLQFEWKQPVAYTFCKGTTPTIQLVRQIKEIIKKCTEIGLKIVATVSDQGATNQAAVNYLMKHSVPQYTQYTGRKFYFVQNKKIIHIYDPPHLLKGIRNNLLTKNLIWETEDEKTDGKVVPQVSKEKVSRRQLCNGHTLFPKSGKDLKCCISLTSKHKKFWIEARHNLSKMYFQSEGKNDKIRPPSLRNWIVTINGLKDLYESLSKEGFSFLKPRVFNQDPVENFFGQLRQQGSRNINPTASMFRIHFKTLLINNFVTRHSPSANCEEETSAISLVRNFVTQGIPEEQDLILNVPDVNIPVKVFSLVDKFSVG